MQGQFHVHVCGHHPVYGHCPSVPRGAGNAESNPNWVQDGAPQDYCGKLWEQAVGFSNKIPSALCLLLTFGVLWSFN